MKAALAVLVLVGSAARAADTPRVYIAPANVERTDAGDKVKPVDCGSAIAAALLKKQVPVVVVTDPARAEWTIRSQCSQREDSTGMKLAKLAFGGGDDSFRKVEATIQVVDNETTAIRYAYSVKDDDSQSAAESFAKHFKNDYLKKR